MKGLPILLLLPLLLGCGSTYRWTKTDLAMGGAFMALQVADTVTTNEILDSGGHEMNPIMGKHPSDTELVLYKAGSSALVLGLAHLFPGKPRKVILGIGIVIAGGCVINNLNVLEE